jgi:hypothetical protein
LVKVSSFGSVKESRAANCILSKEIGSFQLVYPLFCRTLVCRATGFSD